MQPIMSMEEFISQLAWLRVYRSPLGGGEASAAQEPVLEEDEPIPPEPFVYETDPTSAQEEVASPESVPQSSPSPTTILDDIPEPSALALVSDQPIVQDPLVTPVLDLNEHAEDHLQDD